MPTPKTAPAPQPPHPEFPQALAAPEQEQLLAFSPGDEVLGVCAVQFKDYKPSWEPPEQFLPYSAQSGPPNDMGCPWRIHACRLRAAPLPEPVADLSPFPLLYWKPVKAYGPVNTWPYGTSVQPQTFADSFALTLAIERAHAARRPGRHQGPLRKPFSDRLGTTRLAAHHPHQPRWEYYPGGLALTQEAAVEITLIRTQRPVPDLRKMFADFGYRNNQVILGAPAGLQVLSLACRAAEPALEGIAGNGVNRMFVAFFYGFSDVLLGHTGRGLSERELPPDHQLVKFTESYITLALDQEELAAGLKPV